MSTPVNIPLHAAIWAILDETPHYDPASDATPQQVGEQLNRLIDQLQDALAQHP